MEAEVDDVLAHQVFLLDEDRPFAWPDMPVIAPPLTRVPRDDEWVTVVGVVSTLLDGVRRDREWRWWDDMGPDLVVTFGDGPVILAESITTTSGEELVIRGATQRHSSTETSRAGTSR